MSTYNIPTDWNPQGHQLWLEKKIHEAIKTVVDNLNQHQEKKPKGLLLQLAFYLFFINDFLSACTIFQQASDLYPDDNEILLNLAISQSKIGKHKESIKPLSKILRANPKNFTAWDAIAYSYYKIGEHEKAIKAGTNSLRIKEKNSGVVDKDWKIPQIDKQQFTQNKKNVISFSLWGNHERYIYGALRNLLLAPDLFPNWEIWIYTDSSVPKPFLDIFKHLGAKIIEEKDKQNEQQKLTWRFKVVNHSEVGFFLIRDIDSVFSLRECRAVEEWLASDDWFHVIRDWWTHTDLILAGMWGGVAGVLPDLTALNQNYVPEAVNTPNIDQWFLRDCVWHYIKQSCLVHDRLFHQSGSQKIPGIEPSGNEHIGSCEYHQNPERQKTLIAPWIGHGNIPKALTNKPALYTPII